MASQRSTGAFVAGSVIGGIIGAAAVLWKTPKSGAELLGGLSGDRQESVTYRAGEGQTVTEERRFSNPVLSFVEKAAAPIVGVELGKLARDDPQVTAPVRPSAADAKPPASVTGEPVAAQSPDEEVTHDPVAGSYAHAASGEDLTSPTPDYVEHLEETSKVKGGASGDVEFPDLPSREDTR